MTSILPIRAHVVMSITWMCILLLNVIFLQSSTVGYIFGSLYALSVSVSARRRLFPDQTSFIGIMLGGCAALSIYICISVPLYWLIGWFIWGIFGVMFLLPLLITLIPARPRTLCPEDNTIIMTLSTSARTIHGFMVFVFQMALVFMLFRGSVEHAIVSPWEAISPHFFPLFVFTTIILLAYYLRRDASCGVFLSGMHVLIMTMVAVIVFPFGYGFDPFIHRAAVNHIIAHGVLEPKTPYYIGQYTILSGIGQVISVHAATWFDRILVPFFSPLIILSTTVFALRKAGARRFIPIIALIPYVLPFSSFIVTTPQSLAYTFLLVVLISSLSFISSQGVPLLFVWSCAIASLFIHPLAGIPACIAAAYITIITHVTDTRLRVVLGALVCTVSLVMLPLLLFFSSSGSWHEAWIGLFSHISIPSLPWHTTYLSPFDPALSVLYAFRYVMIFLVIAAALYGVFLIFRSHEMRWQALMYSVLVFALFFNASLLSGDVSFPLVIDYEQQNYALRIMEMMVFALFPLFITGAYYAYARLSRTPSSILHIGVVILALALTSGLYFSYPLNNSVERGRGYSVSVDDITTISSIDTFASSSYAVLSNQAISAAAIEQRGFDGEFFMTEQGEQFRYPIPTGGVLYSYFLSMIYESPSVFHAEQVKRFMGVDQLFFVVSPYWWNAQSVVDVALTQTKDSFKVGSNHIFVY